ncbi:MAG TPA: PA domain-containing protein [Thermoanaerobaculia bacterium]|nr:PA domain-containing protein [Thermoanaerobaculia bacterium]
MKTITRFLLLSLVLVFAAMPSFAANFVILNADGPNEGFNDPTPAAPVGGNPGTTLGQQRINAFVHAANIWAQNLDSPETIYVVAAFNPLAPNVLGSAGAWDVFSDFAGGSTFPGVQYPGSEYPLTWYSSALADRRAGYDHDITSPDINAQFSSNFNFYLGLDNNHGPLNDLVAVLLHELGHGLGFQNFVSEATGANLGGFFDGPRFYPVQTDVYSRFTLDTTNNLTWDVMTQAQRQASAIRYGRVVWNGPNVTAAAPGVLSLGSPIVNVLSPVSLAGAYQFGGANFGPPLGSPTVTASIVAAVDPADVAGPTTTDGCTFFTNAAAVAGKIALIERGTCGFTQKVARAQAAGAAAVIIYNNAANAGVAPPTMATDAIFGPTITIPSVSLSRADGLAILAQLGGGVTATIGVDNSLLAGANAANQVRLYMPFPVAGGSSGSHYDTATRRNQLMEPAISADLTHSVNPPEDLTMPLMRDIGWFPDADLDAVDDNIDANPNSDLNPTVAIGGCDSGVGNFLFPNGESLIDKINAIKAAASNHGQYVSGVAHLLNDLKKAGTISGADKDAIQNCVSQDN